MYKRLQNGERDKKEITFDSNTESLKQEYLNIWVHSWPLHHVSMSDIPCSLCHQVKSSHIDVSHISAINYMHNTTREVLIFPNH